MRRQRRGRLVEHQDARAAHQRLGDLHALLLADGEVANQPVGVELQMIVGADLRQPLRRQRPRQPAVRPGLPDQQVFQHGVARHELEMLVHHADAEIQRVGRVADRDRPPLHLDRPRIGRIGAEEDVHQGGLAGTVLAEQAENVATAQRQVDPGHGLHRAEALGDAAHGDEGMRRGRHGEQPPTLSSLPGLTRQSVP